jgi:hypothetical protein
MINDLKKETHKGNVNKQLNELKENTIKQMNDNYLGHKGGNQYRYGNPEK